MAACVSARLAAIGSMMPTRAPTNAFSTSWPLRAICTSSSASPNACRRARMKLTVRAALEDRPLPTGTVDVTRTSKPCRRGVRPAEGAGPAGAGRLRGGGVCGGPPAGAAPGPPRGVGRGGQLDARALRDRDRQHETAVVVGVLADQVDAPGRVRGHVRRPAE